MTEIILCQELRRLISAAVVEMSLHAPDGSVCAPEVYSGFLPFRRQDTEGFPFVVVRPVSSSMTESAITVEVQISIGCYYAPASQPGAEETPDGYEESLVVAERIRQALVDLPNGMLAARFILEMPINISVPEDQAVPYWQVDMTTIWSMRAPKRTNVEFL